MPIKEELFKAASNIIKLLLKYILRIILPGYKAALHVQKQIHELTILTRGIIREQISLDSGERIVPIDLDDIDPNHKKRYEFACQKIKGKLRVLDIACGVGYGSYMLSNNTDLQITGVDISEQAIKYAKDNYKKDNLDFFCADAETYTLDEMFDVVISFETIEHLENDNMFISHITKFLKPGGVLFVSTPNSLLLPRPHKFHYRHYRPRQMSRRLKKYGNLKIKEIYGQLKSRNYDLSKGMLVSYLGDYTVHVAQKIKK